MVYFDCEEERDLCLQNFFWDKKSFDFDLNKRMHALQKLERFWFFFSRFLNLWVKFSLAFLFLKALRESCLVFWWAVREWRHKEEKRKREREERERIIPLFIRISFLIGRYGLKLLQFSPGQESYCSTSRQKIWS